MAMLATLVAGLVSATPSHTDDTRTPVGGAPIIGGYGDFKYQYMPGLLQFPAGAEASPFHGAAHHQRWGPRARLTCACPGGRPALAS